MPLVSFPEPHPASDHSAFDSTTALEAEDTQNGAEVYDPSDSETGSVVEEVVNEPQSKSTPIETVMVIGSDLSATPEEKKSYASIVRLL